MVRIEISETMLSLHLSENFVDKTSVTAPDQKFFVLYLCEIMKPIYLFPLVSAIVLQPSIAFGASEAMPHALTPEQIHKVARSVVLKISVKGEQKSAPIFGSGVLIKKNGSTYTLVTNTHVVCVSGSAYNCKKHKEFSIMTPDQKIHIVKSTAVKNLPDLDLSTIQFQSDRNYSVASFGDSNTVKVDDPIYASGFPAVKNSFSFNHGSIIASTKNRIKGGYTVFYDASTNKGMSGGGVFNSQGQLIAIHGQGDRFTSNSLVNKATNDETKASGSPNLFADLTVGMKVGINRGIPIRHLQDKLFSKKPEHNIDNDSADSWFVRALNKFINNDQQNNSKNTNEAIEFCNEAIKINPDYLMAYYIRALLWQNLDMAANVLNDYKKITQLQPTSSGTYTVRSLANLQTKHLNDRFDTSAVRIDYLNEALNDANKAIKIDSEYPFAYIIRASVYMQDKKISLALADYSHLIKIDPGNSWHFFVRSMLYLQDKKPLLAISDINHAIEIDPLHDALFFYRSQMKLALSDKPGAISDVNRAISLREDNSGDTNIYRLYLASLKNNQPNESGVTSINSQEALNVLQPGTALFHVYRASIKQSQRDFQGALADYNEAVKIDPNSQSFMSRAFFKQKEMKDYQGAEEDYTRAINLASPMRAPMIYMSRAILRLKKLQNEKGAIADLQEALRICKQNFGEAMCIPYTATLSQLRNWPISE